MVGDPAGIKLTVIHCSQNSEKTMLSSSSSPSASQIINRSTPKCKKEGKSINLEPIQLITDLFNDVSNSVHLRNLIPADKKAVAIFFKLDRQCQFVCLKLFTRQKKWYNIHKFCNLVSLDIDDSDLNNMYTIFKENHIIDTDYMCEDFLKLLNLLELADLKYICNKFKSNPKSQRRDDLIKSLFKFRRTQSVLFNSMPAEELLKREIKLKNGTFVLGTFMNSDFITIADYFRNPKLLGQFPKYTSQDYLIFCSEENFKRFKSYDMLIIIIIILKLLRCAIDDGTSCSNMLLPNADRESHEDQSMHPLSKSSPTIPVARQLTLEEKSNSPILDIRFLFSSYERARRYRIELEEVGNNHIDALRICSLMFEELKKLKEVENDAYENAPYLIRYTARAVYVMALAAPSRY
ncbi:hypothetical protein NQ317_006634 [Molorchus minor]|uniref:Phosphodiesterase I n=1 Tax=Molorchus minor TaxID=1323400 RepID=A0ABQ9IVJ8_9CUCU|nr:hypothetical protein NQ317_006634 [Molorchus minor]